LEGDVAGVVDERHDVVVGVLEVEPDRRGAAAGARGGDLGDDLVDVVGAPDVLARRGGVGPDGRLAVVVVPGVGVLDLVDAADAVVEIPRGLDAAVVERFGLVGAEGVDEAAEAVVEEGGDPGAGLDAGDEPAAVVEVVGGDPGGGFVAGEVDLDEAVEAVVLVVEEAVEDEVAGAVVDVVDGIGDAGAVGERGVDAFELVGGVDDVLGDLGVGGDVVGPVGAEETGLGEVVGVANPVAEGVEVPEQVAAEFGGGGVAKDGGLGVGELAEVGGSGRVYW
jgi:hypothetical protein